MFKLNTLFMKAFCVAKLRRAKHLMGVQYPDIKQFYNYKLTRLVNTYINPYAYAIPYQYILFVQFDGYRHPFPVKTVIQNPQSDTEYVRKDIRY